MIVPTFYGSAGRLPHAGSFNSKLSHDRTSTCSKRPFRYQPAGHRDGAGRQRRIVHRRSVRRRRRPAGKRATARRHRPVPRLDRPHAVAAGSTPPASTWPWCCPTPATTCRAEAACASGGAQPALRRGILNLGTLLEKTHRPPGRRAGDLERHPRPIRSEPDIKTNPTLYLVQSLNNLGRLLEIQQALPGGGGQAGACSLRVDPQQSNVMTHWVHLRQKQCEWPVYSGSSRRFRGHLMEGTSALAMLSASGDPAQQLAAARRFVNDKVNADVAPLTGPARLQATAACASATCRRTSARTRSRS
jgi:hypothetical protein